jgi:alanine racemase
MLDNQYTIADVASALNAELVGDENSLVDKISIDSRIPEKNNKTLFFALKTAKNDGHKYVEELINKGVTNFVVERIPDIKNKKANFVVVDNSLLALQNLAKWKRNLSPLKTIGITGSNGKTVVKEWLYQLLKKDFDIVRSPKSYNSQVGVPLSVWEIKPENTLGIFEVGISEPNEMDKLEEIVHPEIGIFTNIGNAHSENFGNLEEKILEKIKLFKNSKKLLYKDDGKLGEIIKNSDSLKHVEKLSWSLTSKANLQVLGVLKGKSSSTITGLYKSEVSTIEIPFIDNASVENAITSWLLMLDFGYSNDEINSRMQFLSPIEMRLEQLEGNNNCTLINDGYSFDLNSLKIALNFLDTQIQHTKRTVILSNVEQSGVAPKKLYQDVADLTKQYKIDKVILVGNEISEYKSSFSSEEVLCFESTEKLIDSINTTEFREEVILVKGARSFRFEKIVKLLAKKTHDTILEINLSAIVRNLNFFKSQLKPKTKMMVMVKAFSYGGGSYEIANVLQYHNADYLAVAYADEGKALRDAGISSPIVVLNPEVSSYETLIKYKLEPEIYSIRVLEEFQKVLSDKQYSIHLKIDSGMHRLGFQKDEISSLLENLNQNKNIKVKSVFSHLSSADDLNESDFTKHQAKYLQDVYKIIAESIGYKPILHLLNSTGIINYPQYQFDMVRIGLGLHGITSNDEAQQFLEPVTSLKTVISQIRTIAKGEGVGYNRKFISQNKMRIATLPIGYADGIDRRWGNEIGEVIINSNRAKIIGVIAMDMLMVDVTEIKCNEGDEVEVFGENIAVAEISEKIGTIPYEILTKISPRVKRIYFQE